MSTSDFDTPYKEVFAPVICHFARWAMYCAAADGYDRLYFLARDMYPVYLAACKLYEADGSLPRPEYIKVSRYALRRAEYALIGERALDHICLNGIDVTFDSVMQRAALGAKDAKKVASETGYAGMENKRLSRSELSYLRKTLWVLPSFRKPFRLAADEALMPARGYLWENGIWNDRKVAICDSGWVGSIQQSIARISEADIKGYYLGLYEIPKDADRSRYETWLFAPESDIGIKVHFSNCLFEAVVSAPFPMTVGYEMYEIGRYRAVEEDVANPNVVELERGARITSAYAEEMAKGSDLSSKDVCENMLRLMSEPTENEAEVFGSLLFSDDVRSEHQKEVAEPFDEKGISEQYLTVRVIKKLLGMNVKESGWLEGSTVRSRVNETVKRRAMRCIRTYKRLMYLRKQCIRRLNSIFS